MHFYVTINKRTLRLGFRGPQQQHGSIKLELWSKQIRRNWDLPWFDMKRYDYYDFGGWLRFGNVLFSITFEKECDD